MPKWDSDQRNEGSLAADYRLRFWLLISVFVLYTEFNPSLESVWQQPRQLDTPDYSWWRKLTWQSNISWPCEGHKVNYATGTAGLFDKGQPGFALHFVVYLELKTLFSHSWNWKRKQTKRLWYPLLNQGHL